MSHTGTLATLLQGSIDYFMSNGLNAIRSPVICRNSKLTMLLQDSLGGDAKALMFCNLASTAMHAPETLSSLGFASKVSNVVLKTPQRKFQETQSKENVQAQSGRQISRR